MSKIFPIFNNTIEEKRHYIAQLSKSGLPKLKLVELQKILNAKIKEFNRIYVTKGILNKGSENKKNSLKIKEKGDVVVSIFITFKGTNSLKTFFLLRGSTDYYYMPDDTPIDNPTFAFLIFLINKKSKV